MTRQMSLFEKDMTIEQMYQEHCDFKAKAMQYMRLLLAKQHEIAKLALEMHQALQASDEAKRKVASKAEKIQRITWHQEVANG